MWLSACRGGTHRKERRRAVGFVNTLALRLNRTGQCDTRALLGRTADLVRQTLEHQLLAL